MEGRKNTITRKQMKFYYEQSLARDTLESLISNLNECDENTNFRIKIGMRYINELTRFDILKNEADYVKRGLRMLCSGEISLKTALERSKELLDDLESSLNLYNEELVKKMFQK